MGLDAAPYEMMAVAIARDLQNGKRVIVGADTQIPHAAVMLAQNLHAPDLKVIFGANCFWGNTRGRNPDLYVSSGAYQMIRWAESRFDHPEIFHRLWAIDHFFAGGIEVDKFGNVNILGIPDGAGGWKFRAAGPVGLPDIAVNVREPYIFSKRHDRRVLVDRVALNSCPGYLDGPGGRERLGLWGKGPRWIITPKCIFDFHPESKRARLHRLLPGVTVQEVIDATGFEIVFPERVEVLPGPSEEELHLLRSIDKEGNLRVRPK